MELLRRCNSRLHQNQWQLISVLSPVLAFMSHTICATEGDLEIIVCGSITGRLGSTLNKSMPMAFFFLSINPYFRIPTVMG